MDETVEVKSAEEEIDEVKPKEDVEESSYHLSMDEIDEFEESQAKFRTLWEKKRDKVSESSSVYQENSLSSSLENFQAENFSFS